MLEPVGINFNQITLIELSHKWTEILFIISNSKPGIWIYSQPRIYLNSQPNLYGVLTLDHTILFPTNIQTTYLEHILHLVPPYYELFKQVLSNFIFLCVHCLQELIFTTTHAQTFDFLICHSQNFLPTSLIQKISLELL